MAISFKKLVNDDEEEELETSVADKESVEIREEEHPAPKRKRFTLAGRVSRPRGVFGKKSCSRLSSWSVAFIAITVFTIAVVLSLFIALLLAEPTEPPSGMKYWREFQFLLGVLAYKMLACSMTVKFLYIVLKNLQGCLLNIFRLNKFLCIITFCFLLFFSSSNFFHR